MSDSFPLEALKAQAVCARTYALSHLNASRAYDVVDTTNDQVFKGVDSSTKNAARAVQETAGIVGMYNGKLAECFYSASNGGQTELVENVWSGSGDYGYYAMVDDPYDLENPQSIVRTMKISKNGTVKEALRTLIYEQMLPVLTREEYSTDEENFRIDEITAVTLDDGAGGDAELVGQEAVRGHPAGGNGDSAARGGCDLRRCARGRRRMGIR